MIRRVEEKDYPVLAEWFSDTAWPLPPSPNILPKDGFILEQNDQPIACAFVYLNGTGKADISWINVEPRLTKEIAAESIKELVEHIKGFCDHLQPKVSLLTIYTQDESIADLLSTEGFYKTSKFYRLTWMVRP